MDSPSHIDDSAASSPEARGPPAKKTKGAASTTGKKRGRPAKAPAKRAVKAAKVVLPKNIDSVVQHHTEELFGNSQSFTEGEDSRTEAEDTSTSTVREAEADQTEGEEQDETREEEESQSEESEEEEEEEEEGEAGPEDVSQVSEMAAPAAVSSKSKASGKGKSVAKKEVSMEKKKKRRKSTKGLYTMYIYKVFRQLNKDMRISTQSMEIMNSFTNDMFERIVNEAAVLAKHNKKRTMGANEIQTATRLVIGYNSLGDHAVAEGMKALALYKRSNEKE